MSVLFISGIDTDIGKTYATGMMAKALMQQGISVITQKLVQTGVSIDSASGKMNIRPLAKVAKGIKIGRHS